MKKHFIFLGVVFIITLLFSFSFQDNKPKQKKSDSHHFSSGSLINHEHGKTQDAQISISSSYDNSMAYLEEGFESTTFPPAGWATVNILGTDVWERSTFLPRNGVGCAFINWDFKGGEDWMITPQFSANAGDSLIFWLCLPNFVDFPPDSLTIRISTTTQTPANETTFPTRLLYIADGNGYPTITGVYQRYAVGLGAFAGQNIYVAFRHANVNGDGINIDDVAIGTPPPNDVGTFSIDLSNPAPSGNQLPKATVRNFGSVAQSFPVTMNISGGYTSQQTVSNLPPGTNQQVTFSNWNPVPGSYQITVYTQLGSDVNRNNDTLRTTISVLGNFSNCGWTARAPVLTQRATTANAFWRSGSPPNDTGYIFVIGGANPTFTDLVTNNTRYNIRTNTWQEMAPIGIGRYHAQAVTARNRIYVMGGYNPNFVSLNNNDIYDPVTNTWSTGSPIPIPVGDFAIGVYRDSLIYVIAGYDGSGDQNAVQIFNVASNTWTTGTPKPGAPCAGLRGSIYGNKIVVAGGYSQLQGSNFDSAYAGTINPANPTQITWSGNIKYPGGRMGRLAAGSTPFGSNNNFPYVFFTGGDSTGFGSTASRVTWGYNVNLNLWEIVTAKPTPSNNINNFVGVMKSDSLFMVNVGGWDGTQATTVNEWLCLGLGLVGITQTNGEIPTEYLLAQNYPNPFNPSTKINYSIPKSGLVTLKIYSVIGKEVMSLINEQKSAGNYEVEFNSADLPSGAYFYKLESGNFNAIKRMILIK